MADAAPCSTLIHRHEHPALSAAMTIIVDISRLSAASDDGRQSIIKSYWLMH